MVASESMINQPKLSVCREALDESRDGLGSQLGRFILGVAMREIRLTRGDKAIVDDEDFKWLSLVKWWAQPSNGRSYAVRHKKGCEVRMHRAIIEKLIQRPLGRFEYVDHVNGDGLDNRRGNIRIATPSQNSQNKVGSSAQSRTSIYKGVSWKSRDGVWVAQILVEKLKIHLGYFQEERDAAIQYDCAARFYFGEFARLNLPLLSTPDNWIPPQRNPPPKSSLRGVTFNDNNRFRKWRARVCLNNERFIIGSFLTQEEAGRAHDKLYWELTGDAVKLNFPAEYIAYG